ncbi:hypothetical protein L2E82_35595 [Cichorium intybus]|uniref:Uncharacterized protein n=1 Tax=Cichorium intybus TaxID=13427 RepID=A0ACB9BPK0_CICIN|nr:hypothetical protein L2E82_35595 [Cichorium intybus]
MFILSFSSIQKSGSHSLSYAPSSLHCDYVNGRHQHRQLPSPPPPLSLPQERSEKLPSSSRFTDLSHHLSHHDNVFSFTLNPNIKALCPLF